MESSETKDRFRQSEQRLNLALECAQLGAWEYDFASDSGIRSLRHDQIMGYSTLQPEWGFATFLKQVVPEDRELAKREMQAARDTGRLNMEVRILWPDGSLHWISAQGQVSRNERGEPVRMSGV